MTSSQPLPKITVDQLKGLVVDILSVFNDKLLVSCYGISQLFIYSREGRHLSTIKTNNNDQLRDAAWTPRGNIVYTTYFPSDKVVVMSESGKVITTHTQMTEPHCLSVSSDDIPSDKVVVMSESGKVITTHTQMTEPHCLSVSSDDIIYLADSKTGVYQSTDDGVSWSLVFKSTDGWHCFQTIKVTTDHSDDFWTLENYSNNYQLSVYSVDRRRSDGNVTWRDIVPKTYGKHINLSYRSSLSYDGNMNIFLSDFDNKVVHKFSVNGQYHWQLLSSYRIMNMPRRLAVDKKRQLLYVGQWKGLVQVFELKYWDWGD